MYLYGQGQVWAFFVRNGITPKRNLLVTLKVPLWNRLGGAVNFMDKYYEIWQQLPGTMKNSNFLEFGGFCDVELFHVLQEIATAVKMMQIAINKPAGYTQFF